MITETILTCPHCGNRTEEAMPETFCVVRHACVACGAEVTPKKGDCCIFCSHADMPCPPVQKGRSCCSDD